MIIKNFLKKWAFLGLVIVLTGMVVFLFWKWRTTTTTTTTTFSATSSVAPMSIAVDSWPGNYWVIVADQKGYFKEAGLNVKVVDVSADYNASITDVAEGRLDTTLMTVFDLVNQNIQGSKLAGVLQADTSEGAEGIVADASIKNLRELRGKKIGVEAGTYLEYYLKIALAHVSIDGAEYIAVNAKTNDLMALLERHEVDAIITWDPDLSALVTAGYSLLFSTADIKGFSPDLFVFRQDFIAKRSEDIQRMTRAWLSATEFIEENPDQAYALVSQFHFADSAELYSPEEIKALIHSAPIATLEDNLKAFSFTSGYASFYGQAEAVSRFLQRSGMIVSLPATNSFFDPRFIYSLPIPYE